MYRCRECGRTYDEPYEYEECMESYYGVSGMFSSSSYSTFEECPYCGNPHSDSIEFDEDDE